MEWGPHTSSQGPGVDSPRLPQTPCPSEAWPLSTPRPGPHQGQGLLLASGHRPRMPWGAVLTRSPWLRTRGQFRALSGPPLLTPLLCGCCWHVLQEQMEELNPLSYPKVQPSTSPAPCSPHGQQAPGPCVQHEGQRGQDRTLSTSCVPQAAPVPGTSRCASTAGGRAPRALRPWGGGDAGSWVQSQGRHHLLTLPSAPLPHPHRPLRPVGKQAGPCLPEAGGRGHGGRAGPSDL